MPPPQTNFIMDYFNIYYPSSIYALVQNYTKQKNLIVDVHYVNTFIILNAHKKCKLKVKQCMHDHTFSRFMYNNSIKNNLLKCWHLIIMPNFMTIQKNCDITAHILWIFSKIKCTNKTHALNTVTLSSSICVASLPLTFEATKIATAFPINCHHETHLVWF